MSHISRRDWIKASSAAIAGCALGSPLLGSARAGAHGPFGATLRGPQLVIIPAGMFRKGTTAPEADQLATLHGYDASWFASEVPAELVDLPTYAIRKYPVTQAEYAVFCAATGHAPPLDWQLGQPSPLQLDHPVTCLTRADAAAFAAWCGMRLPTELEWEKAARGTDGRVFPWGDTFDPGACRWGIDPNAPPPWTAPVAAHPTGASPYGVMDLIGNVAEYCCDGPDPSTAFIKGGNWRTTELVNLRAAARNMSGAVVNPSNFYGFRCVKDLA